MSRRSKEHKEIATRNAKARVQRGVQPYVKEAVIGGVGDPHMVFTESLYALEAPRSYGNVVDPCQTLMYDLLYEAFQQDEEFWEEWSVYDCCQASFDSGPGKERWSENIVYTANYKEVLKRTLERDVFEGDVLYAATNRCLTLGEMQNLEGEELEALFPIRIRIGKETAPLRVVFDLPDLHPLPHRYPERSGELPAAHSDILPDDLSAPIVGFTIEGAKHFLERQRTHMGKIGEDYEWLDEIIDKYDEEQQKETSS
eukprot:TRINITY_DN71794_c0_g1_i1.p1 TRINITY_DN71794_c0_g1~~TRINITY_DN71794_c0_g1_i1.p1  ORF type:complete len:256 (-),score=27.78 TRINITY_DN71794_c0_g1_i1:19-786(-)